jgi:hypothetical protein
LRRYSFICFSPFEFLTFKAFSKEKALNLREKQEELIMFYFFVIMYLLVGVLLTVVRTLEEQGTTFKINNGIYVVVKKHLDHYPNKGFILFCWISPVLVGLIECLAVYVARKLNEDCDCHGSCGGNCNCHSETPLDGNGIYGDGGHIGDDKK